MGKSTHHVGLHKWSSLILGSLSRQELESLPQQCQFQVIQVWVLVLLSVDLSIWEMCRFCVLVTTTAWTLTFASLVWKCSKDFWYCYWKVRQLFWRKVVQDSFTIPVDSFAVISSLVTPLWPRCCKAKLGLQCLGALLESGIHLYSTVVQKRWPLSRGAWVIVAGGAYTESRTGAGGTCRVSFACQPNLPRW